MTTFKKPPTANPDVSGISGSIAGETGANAGNSLAGTGKTEADYRDEKWTECPQCGWMGGLWELNEHPFRPSPMDLGFCPECGGECDDVFGTAEKDRRIAEYDA